MSGVPVWAQDRGPQRFRGREAVTGGRNEIPSRSTERSVSSKRDRTSEYPEDPRIPKLGRTSGVMAAGAWAARLEIARLLEAGCSTETILNEINSGKESDTPLEMSSVAEESQRRAIPKERASEASSKDPYSRVPSEKKKDKLLSQSKGSRDASREGKRSDETHSVSRSHGESSHRESKLMPAPPEFPPPGRFRMERHMGTSIEKASSHLKPSSGEPVWVGSSSLSFSFGKKAVVPQGEIDDYSPTTPEEFTEGETQKGTEGEMDDSHMPPERFGVPEGVGSFRKKAEKGPPPASTDPARRKIGYLPKCGSRDFRRPGCAFSGNGAPQRRGWCKRPDRWKSVWDGNRDPLVLGWGMQGFSSHICRSSKPSSRMKIDQRSLDRVRCRPTSSSWLKMRYRVHDTTELHLRSGTLRHDFRFRSPRSEESESPEVRNGLLKESPREETSASLQCRIPGLSGKSGSWSHEATGIPIGHGEVEALHSSLNKTLGPGDDSTEQGRMVQDRGRGESPRAQSEGRQDQEWTSTLVSIDAGCEPEKWWVDGHLCGNPLQGPWAQVGYPLLLGMRQWRQGWVHLRSTHHRRRRGGDETGNGLWSQERSPSSPLRSWDQGLSLAFV